MSVNRSTPGTFDKKRPRDQNEEYTEAFSRSKKVIRSPDQTTQRKKVEIQQTNMGNEELKEMMERMMNRMTDEIRANTEEIKEEIKNVRREMREKEEKWKAEKEELMKRIEKLEERQEKEEKDKRRNNIILKGINSQKGNERETVKNFLKEELKVEAEITQAYTVGNNEQGGIILAQIGTWQNKQQIMQNKSSLKGRNIYVEDDMTKYEREVQREIRNIAKGKRAEGKTAKVGYQKIFIDNVEYRWDKGEYGVIEYRKDHTSAKN